MILRNFVISDTELEELVSTWSSPISLDIETVDLVNTLPLGIGIGLDRDRGLYFMDIHNPLLKKLVAQAPFVIVHNSKYDVPLLLNYGLSPNGFEDTLTMAYSSGQLEFSLAKLSAKLLNRDCPSVTDQWEKTNQGNINIDHKEMGRICIIHATNTYYLYDVLEKTDLYSNIDKPFLSCLVEMEEWGLLVNQYRLTQLEMATYDLAQQAKKELMEELGEINLNSVIQVRKALLAKGIPLSKKTKSGADAVSEEALRPLNLPLTNALLDYRSLMKTLTTYVPAFRSVDNKGRLHTTFGYTGTGRLSSSKPNLQNMTANSKFGDNMPSLRSCIVSEEGYTFVSIDASQLELRVVAQLSQDPTMLEAVDSQDLHMTTAIKVFGQSDDVDLMKARRYLSKQLNFALLYGANEYRISEMADTSVSEAKAMIDQYFQTHRQLYIWMQQEKVKAKRLGYTTNLFGRVRPLPNLYSDINGIRNAAEREIVNTIVQGTAVDIIKMMQMYLKKIVPEEVRFVLQVHDEILMEVPDGQVDTVCGTLRELIQAFPYYPVQACVGKNYGELEDIEC